MEARHWPEYEYESVGTSCTKMWRQIRATLYGDSHLDVDQVNTPALHALRWKAGVCGSGREANFHAPRSRTTWETEQGGECIVQTACTVEWLELPHL